MMNKRYIYICINNPLAILLVFVLASVQSIAQQGIKVQEGDKPTLFIDPAKQTQDENKGAVNKETQSMVLFPAKSLELVEANLNNVKPYFNRFKAEDLISSSIKGMYLPSADPQTAVCDLMIADGFDKGSLPPLDTDFNKELIKVMNPELVNEVFYCLAYLGVSVTASDFYIYYAAPYKAELAAIQQSKLQGRELAWVIANDFKQSVCLREPIMYIDKMTKQKFESKQSKINQ